MTHDPHTTDVNPHGGPRPEPRPGWLDRHEEAANVVAIFAGIVLIFLIGTLIGASLS